MAARLPFVIVSDGPNEPTGLGKIARDLAAQIVSDPQLGPMVDLLHVGGPPIPHFVAWPHVPMGEAERLHDWGASFVTQLYESKWGRQPGILWVIWDPSRLMYYIEPTIPVQIWSYPALDATNRNQTISGPVGGALQRADRVIAYGRWASQVVRSLRESVPYLPHGLSAAQFTPVNEDEAAWARDTIGAHRKAKDRIVGCVATNQARKDLGLYCETLSTLIARGHSVYGWLHTDTTHKAWDVDQLIADHGLYKKLTVTLSHDDRELAALYQACRVTVAPGLGEGFGYPIVESLAGGVPVVHGDYAGGKELIPKIEWRFPVRELRTEGVYGLRRPVFRADDVANAIERVWDWQESVGEATAQAYCRGAVAHLDWAALWPRWRSWVKAGLE